jgi:phage/plasmid-associated DNA primase
MYEENIKGFIDERCVLGAEQTVITKDLYRAYHEWAEEKETARYSAIGFANSIRKAVPDVWIVKGGGVRRWQGIGLRQ